jgi:hypothetical protein
MKRQYKVIGTTLALLACLALACAPAQAAVDHAPYGYVYLLDNGATAVNETTDWRVYVEVPSGPYIDAESWTFLCYAEFLNNSGTGADATLVITMTLDDGTAVAAANATISASAATTAKQYGNITFTSPNATLTASEEATWTVSMTVDAVAADSATGEFEIYDSKEQSAIAGIMPMVMLGIVAAAMLGLVGQMMRKLEF